MHQHSGHSHSHGTEQVSDRLLLATVFINLGLSVFEFIAGLISASTALMADALHNTNDAAALLVAYVARRVSRKGADHKFTFGYRRAELIGAMIQLTALIVVGLYLLYEAVRRFAEPEPVLGGWMMAAAGVALVVDVATALLLWSMSRGSLNVKAAFFHNLTDAAASLAVMIGGAAVLWLGWTWIDPVLTLGIAGYILHMSVGMLRRTSAILMEGVPGDVRVDEVKGAVESIPGIVEMHHIHIWELDERLRAIEAHVVIATGSSMSELESLKAQARALLGQRFRIAHSTLEMESEGTACEWSSGRTSAG
ncbi:MAG: cation diffusion facilitator family transporter [Puniceicoccaceae bacterium]